MTTSFIFSLQQVQVASYINGLTYGTPVTFDSSKTLSLSKKYVSDRAQGNSQITSLAAQSISYDLTLETSGFQDAALAIMEGITATVSNAQSNFDESNDLMPYFGLIAQGYPDTGDVLLFFPRCKITSDINYKLEFGKIVAPQIKIEAIRDTTLGYLMRRRTRSSSGLAITFPLTA